MLSSYSEKGAGMASDEQLRLLAWIESRGTECQASFVAESAAKLRTPAMRRFGSPDEARQWVMKEADAVRAPVKWIAEASMRDGRIVSW